MRSPRKPCAGEVGKEVSAATTCSYLECQRSSRFVAAKLRMRVLHDTELLNLWERGARRHPLDRALLALAAALPQVPSDTLADWPIGRRNQQLARLRCQCFGPLLRGWATCVKCGEKLEFEMDGKLLSGQEKHDLAGHEETVTINDRIFRLPTSRDLAQAAQALDPAEGAARLATSCQVAGPVPAKWEEAELVATGEALALADPLAETRITFRCPDCGSEWKETLDFADFFWTELQARIRHLLLEIHTLASAYGWSEADILALSPERRATYLEMARG